MVVVGNAAACLAPKGYHGRERRAAVLFFWRKRSMKLYYMPGACSLAAHIVLEWIGQPYDTRKLARDELKQPEFLQINPLGAVPALVDGDLALTQNAAILEYLAEQAPQPVRGDPLGARQEHRPVRHGQPGGLLRPHGARPGRAGRAQGRSTQAGTPLLNRAAAARPARCARRSGHNAPAAGAARNRTHAGGMSRPGPGRRARR